MTARATRFTRLVVTVPRLIAEPFAAALVELGAGAVEERELAESGESEWFEAGVVEEQEAAESESTGSNENERIEASVVEDAESESTEPNETELVLTLPEAADLPHWESLVQVLYRAFSEQLDLAPQDLRLEVESCEFDYHAQWLADLVPQPLTDKIRFVPTHHRDEGTSSERVLYFEPHPSFGDGSHPTTRLASRAVERACEQMPKRRVLDVGTGNGVLSFVAAVSGARSCYGIDLDPEAIASARRNAMLNQLEDACAFDDALLGTITARFDLVVANLEPRTQVELIEQIAARVEPRGTLVLTGFLVEQAAAITAPLAALGFTRSYTGAAQDYALEVWQADDALGRACDHGRGGVR